MHIKVNNGQATLTISGTNIQIPLGPSAAAAAAQNNQSNTSQNSSNTSQNVQQQSGSANVSQQQTNANNQSQGATNQQQQQQQQQGTQQMFTIPTGNGGTIQIPANAFSGGTFSRCMAHFTVTFNPIYCNNFDLLLII